MAGKGAGSAARVPNDEPKASRLGACEFCDVLDGRARGGPVVLSDASVVILIGRRQPTGPGYCLVIARRHVAGLAGLNDAELVTLWRSVNRVQGAITEVFGVTGATVIVNDGPPAQHIEHLHVHVVPRRVGDGWPSSVDEEVPEAELMAQAEQLGAVLKAPEGRKGHG